MTTRNKVIISILSSILALLIIAMGVFLVFTAMTAKAQSSFSITFTSSVPNNFTIEWSAVANGSYYYYELNGKESLTYEMNGDIYHDLPGAGDVLGRGKYKYRQGNASSRTISIANYSILSNSDIWLGFAITPDVLSPMDISITLGNTGTRVMHNLNFKIYEVEGTFEDGFSASDDYSLGYASYDNDGVVTSSNVVWNTTSHPLVWNLGTEPRSVTFTENNFSYSKLGATNRTVIYLRIKSNDISTVSDLMGNLVISIS